MNRQVLLALIVVVLVCICLVVAGTGGLIFIARGTLAPVAVDVSPAPAVAPTSAIPSNATESALLRAQIPERNLNQVVPRLRKNLALLTPVPTPAPRAWNVGDRDAFFVTRSASTGEYRTVNAILQVITPHSFFWVEEGVRFDLAALQKSADFFEKKVYPTNLNYFGSPGVGLDGDTRIHILNTRFEDAAGYFSSVDTYPRALVPYSNQRNIIYMNIEALQLNSDEYNGDLAHEFQHLIHDYQAKYKTGWIDEGMGDLAIKVNGFPVLGVTDIFARHPDTQLNTWSESPQAAGAHYAASYLFFDYVAGRFGPEFIRDVIHAPREGINGVQAVLDQRAGALRFDDLFGDWAVTNIVNDSAIAGGRYAYTNESTFRVTRVPNLDQYPITRAAQTPQYAASYFSLQPGGNDVTIYFTGTTTTKLLLANAHSGRWMWYSNRADMLDTTLTRQFDLTRVGKATLRFWTWYDIEMNYDYAYVQVSTDNGKTWDILPGKYTTTSNPNGASYGHAYTGRSGIANEKSQDPARWVQEQMDLLPYAGKTILLRFEYITDDAYNAPSWAIDDIAIPEINYSDDAEVAEGGWQAAGFIRTDNVLPQRYIVQVVEMGTPTRIVRIPLDAQNRGNLTVAGFGKNVAKATLVVTAHAPTTTEPTEYQFSAVVR